MTRLSELEIVRSKFYSTGAVVDVLVYCRAIWRSRLSRIKVSPLFDERQLARGIVMFF